MFLGHWLISLYKNTRLLSSIDHVDRFAKKVSAFSLPTLWQPTYTTEITHVKLSLNQTSIVRPFRDSRRSFAKSRASERSTQSGEAIRKKMAPRCNPVKRIRDAGKTFHGDPSKNQSFNLPTARRKTVSASFRGTVKAGWIWDELSERASNRSFRVITSYSACKQRRAVGEIPNAFDCREQSVKSSSPVFLEPLFLRIRPSSSAIFTLQNRYSIARRDPASQNSNLKSHDDFANFGSLEFSIILVVT